MKEDSGQKKLTANISPAAILAFSLGTAIGWGSLVVTSSTYLAQSGIMGSILGMLIGAVVMLIIARNYTYLLQMYPEAGGAYTYSREVFGFDYGFLTAWFLTITYLSVLWANATSVPLFVRYFIGDEFQFGKLYTIFGYDIYIGEIILTILALFIFSLLCMKAMNAAINLNVVLAAVFVITISAVSIGAIILHRGTTWEPLYVPETSVVNQIVRIAVISPWAFIGFECVTHAAEEFSFEKNKLFRILVISVIITTLLYMLITALSMTAYPERYASWLEYIRDRGNLEGLEALPAFYAARHYMGSFGVTLLMAALLALVMTSLIGNTFALSRLFYALARDKLLPVKFSRLDERSIPKNAITLIFCMSMLVPFVGRNAIGWIVDVTTIGATLVYGVVSAAAWKKAKAYNDGVEKITGISGIIIMVGFALYTLLPNLISSGSIERETYFLFIIWSILGFIYFRSVLDRDKERKYGSSVIVWAAMLSFLLFISVVWMRQSMIASNNQMISNIKDHYSEDSEGLRLADEEFIEEQLHKMEREDTRAIVITMLLFSAAVTIMFSNHSYMNRLARENEKLANIDPLTGVKSKLAYFNKEREMDGLIEEGESPEFSIAVCDLNGLKNINDTLGHQTGDMYIREASALICRTFAHSPVYRIGGDEFAVVMSGDDYRIRHELIKKIHDASVENLLLGKVVVSAAEAAFDPAEDRDFHSVFERADKRMYEEKIELKKLGAEVRQ